ncbi:TetR family transcriptional regulator [Lactobacillus rossiae]|jgi:AcrR family transcriptional regulator|uniref:TetR family transcriptional regulator n=1 Tax=Furfurilactobacillus rossiae TaxID=231049 RepID=A0A7C9MIC1_9LACO|nr:TetR family transcriptional regulator [Furfurilactobacillus milii]
MIDVADLRTTDTRQRIVEYAVKFVGENDFHLLSLRTAAKTVGIAPSAVYKHFKSKDDLLDAALQEVSRQFETEAIQSVAQLNPKEHREIIAKLGKMIVSWAGTRPHAVAFLFFSPRALAEYRQQNFFTNTEEPFLRYMSQEVAGLKQDYHLTEESDLLFTKLWSFIFGYAQLIVNGALIYDEAVVDSMIDDIVKNGGVNDAK